MATILGKKATLNTEAESNDRNTLFVPDAEALIGPYAETQTRNPTNATGNQALPDLTASVGVPIPTSAFRVVDVTLEDPSGKALTNLNWVGSAGIFPTLAPVDSNGRASIYLLKVHYNSFLAVADLESIDAVWYSTPQSDIVGPLDDEATIVLEPQKPSTSNLQVGGGASLG